MRFARRALTMTTLFVAACGYPSFDFVPDDSGAAPIDSTVDALDAAVDVGDASPNSFLSRFIATTGSEEAAVLVEPLSAPLTYATVQLDVDIKLDVGHYDAGIVLEKIGRPGTGRGFDLSLGPSDFYVEVLGTTNVTTHLTTTPVPVGRYFHLRMKGQVMLAGATVTLWIDDPSTPAYDASGLSTATEDDVKQQIDLGLYSDVSPFAAFDAHYDTAAVDYP